LQQLAANVSGEQELKRAGGGAGDFHLSRKSNDTPTERFLDFFAEAAALLRPETGGVITNSNES
jgi:hypothetical protein